ncbi:MAG: tail fiber assembly protein [Aeromonas sp.]
MKYYYSFSQAGFYNEVVNTVPADAVELLPNDYRKLLKGLESQKRIICVNGYPELEDIPPQSATDIAKSQLATKIAVAAQQVDILKPAVDGGYAKPEHTKLLADWQRYRYELTAVPELNGWPASPAWPQEPATVG